LLQPPIAAVYMKRQPVYHRTAQVAFFHKRRYYCNTSYCKLGYRPPIMALNKLDNETDIVKRVANGDEKAFAKLFYTYYNQIGGFIQGLTQDPEVTEEIVQEVFTKIWIDRQSLCKVKRF